jgi:hypothetical protein
MSTRTDPPASVVGVDARRLWFGGLATALVAALIALVGIVVARGVFGIPILAPKGGGRTGAVRHRR